MGILWKHGMELGNRMEIVRKCSVELGNGVELSVWEII